MEEDHSYVDDEFIRFLLLTSDDDVLLPPSVNPDVKIRLANFSNRLRDFNPRSGVRLLTAAATVGFVNSANVIVVVERSDSTSLLSRSCCCCCC